MYIFKQKAALKRHLRILRERQIRIGYVPTMGALHEGHFALIERAISETDIVICSIFINPTQFNDAQDLKRYPVQTDSDIQKLLEHEMNILFLPSVNEIYPDGLKHLEHYSFGALETMAEGLHRPGHFQGVGQVLSRFLEIIKPDRMFMGQKDYQQLLMTRKLVRLADLKTEIVAVPIRRERDGLAMSSRNIRLSEEARKTAPELYKTLYFVSTNLDKQPLDALLETARKQLEEKGFKVDYLILADAEDLQAVDRFTEKQSLVLLAAAWLEGVRLIDNILVNTILS